MISKMSLLEAWDDLASPTACTGQGLGACHKHATEVPEQSIGDL